MVVMCRANPKTNMPTFITVRPHQDFKMIQGLCTILKEQKTPKRIKASPLFISAKQ